MEVMRQVLHVTHIIHLHGVKGYEEHLSLSILPSDLVHGLLGYLKEASYQGVVVLEVFNARDLEESMNILLKTS
jgi:hypothetical protein